MERIPPSRALTALPVPVRPAAAVPAVRPRPAEPRHERPLQPPRATPGAPAADGPPQLRLHPLRQRIEYAGIFEAAATAQPAPRVTRRAHARLTDRYAQAHAAYRRWLEEDGAG